MKNGSRNEHRGRRYCRWLFALLPALGLLFAFPPRILAGSCSSPPTGYGADWARAYQSWCVSCCGTFSMSGGNPSCSPGSNWGCRGAQGSTPTPNGAIYNGFYQMGYQLGQGIGKSLFGDPQEEARQNAIAAQRNRQMLNELDAMSKEQMQQEDEMFRNASEQTRQLEARRQQEAISALKGIPGGGADLAMKPSTAFFGVPGNPAAAPPPSDPSVVDLRQLDPEKPIVVDNLALREFRPRETKPRLSAEECGSRKASRDRLAAGLPVQEESIRRTQAQLEAAERATAEASAEKRRILLEGAIQEATEYAKDVVTSARYLRSQVDLLKQMNLDAGKRDLLIRSLDTAIFEGEGLAKAAKAGYESGDEMRRKADRLSTEILPNVYKLLMDSGIAEKAGEGLSEKLGGPLGALAFRGARLSIDFTVALGNGRIGESERQAARRNLYVMENQHRRARTRIAELEKTLADSCPTSQQARP